MTSELTEHTMLVSIKTTAAMRRIETSMRRTLLRLS
jgi:hypothetical protein